jgi:hypothetical protein
MTNQYPGQCGTCGQRVEAGEGTVTKVRGRWTPFHAAGQCPENTEAVEQAEAVLASAEVGDMLERQSRDRHARAAADQPRPNRYGGTCGACGAWVDEGEGTAVKVAGSWTARHIGECPVPAPVGIYRDPEGTIWLVKESRGQKDVPVEQRRRYAKKMIESAAARFTEGGDSVRYDWEIVRGAVYRLTEDMRVPLDDEQVTALMIATGKCIVCDHAMWAEKTLRRAKETGVMVGPVCVKSFAPARFRQDA